MIGQQLITSTTSSGTNSSMGQKVISSIKKQSPATKYDKEKELMLKDEKKMKVKMLQKKIG